jgi:hypothetical protein
MDTVDIPFIIGSNQQVLRCNIWHVSWRNRHLAASKMISLTAIS